MGISAPYFFGIADLYIIIIDGNIDGSFGLTGDDEVVIASVTKLTPEEPAADRITKNIVSGRFKSSFHL